MNDLPILRFIERPPGSSLVLDALEDYSFDLAGPDSAPELVVLFEQFFNEAHYKDRGVVYSPENTEKWLRLMLPSFTPHILAHRDGKIVGFCSYGLDATFCEKPVAILHGIYVIPELRKTAIGLVLATIAMDLAKGDGAVAFHAPLASGMAEQSSLKNLFARCGCEEIGTIMGRSL